MGRPRSFDEAEVVAAAAGMFIRLGYEGTSVDDLVQGTGVHRGSLYQAFGSKRGLFVASLRAAADRGPGGPAGGPPADDLLDLLLVAALEVAPRDPEVAALLSEACDRLAARLAAADPDAVATLLGRRLLERAHTSGAPAPVTREVRT